MSKWNKEKAAFASGEAIQFRERLQCGLWSEWRDARSESLSWHENGDTEYRIKEDPTYYVVEQLDNEPIDMIEGPFHCEHLAIEAMSRLCDKTRSVEQFGRVFQVVEISVAAETET